MTKEIKKTKEIKEPKAQKVYFFPGKNKSVKATSLEEARGKVK